MSDRVLSSGQARQSIQKFQQILNGPLMDQINALNTEGTTLSDPNVWDGRLASEFRSTWPETKSKLDAMRSALEDLRRRVAQINEDIMRAGGNQ